MIYRQDFVDEARRWIGTPFQHQCSLRGVAADCIGLITGVAAACGSPEAEAFRNDREFAGYSTLPDPGLQRRACRRYLDEIDIANAELADLLHMEVLFEPMHFAIISRVMPYQIIHSWAPVGKVVEHGMDEKWKRRVIAAYRVRGME